MMFKHHSKDVMIYGFDDLYVASEVRDGWEHVSVVREDRIPTWEEMCMVKSMFWDDEDCVVQFHPPKSKYVNISPNALHLWRREEIPVPSVEMASWGLIKELH